MKQSHDIANIPFPPPLLFLGTIGLGYSLDRALGLDPIELPSAIRWASTALIGAGGFALIGSALKRFRRAGTAPEPWEPTSAIVETGLYARTRNPMYLGMAAVQLAAGFALRSPGIIALVLPALILVDLFVVRREEAYLARRFGAPYLAYKARVRRWI